MWNLEHLVPENPLTREQMAIMVRTLEKVGVDMSPSYKENPYRCQNISATTVSYIDKVYGAGLILSITAGTFAPQKYIESTGSSHCHRVC